MHPQDNTAVCVGNGKHAAGHLIGPDTENISDVFWVQDESHLIFYS